MKNTYKISKAWHWTDDNELRIESEHLEFIEASGRIGLQCENTDNHNDIEIKCVAILKLIRDIEELNKLRQ